MQSAFQSPGYDQVPGDFFFFFVLYNHLFRKTSYFYMEESIFFRKGAYMIAGNNTDCRCKNNRVAAIYHHLREADAPLAMGYVPDQHWEHTFEPARGLKCGTIFPELQKPFCGRGGAWK